MRHNHYRLVLRGTKIDGLVTQSDLLKLPVRMLLFAYISHLEVLLRSAAEQRASWPGWLQVLRPDAQGRIRKRLDSLVSARLEPNPIDVTDFRDVLQVVTKYPRPGDDLTQANALADLRNQVAHAGDYIAGPGDVVRFVDLFQYTTDWIARETVALDTSDEQDAQETH